MGLDITEWHKPGEIYHVASTRENANEGTFHNYILVSSKGMQDGNKKHILMILFTQGIKRYRGS